MSESKDLITIKDLCVHYPIRAGFFNRITDYVYAVDGVNFTIKEGQSYGIIGESGSGKSTIGKTIVGLEKATHGQIIYDGYDVTKRKNRKKHKYNKDVQMIFQDLKINGTRHTDQAEWIVPYPGSMHYSLYNRGSQPLPCHSTHKVFHLRYPVNFVPYINPP
mgnify:CR=1 FL=1